LSFFNIHLQSTLSFFFFLMLPPPPTSTLFPYTTLFRSILTMQIPLRGPRYEKAQQLDSFYRRLLERIQTLPSVRVVAVSNSLPPDRKSTRLNSSHDQISYAVFCLKKKKIKECMQNI